MKFCGWESKSHPCACRFSLKIKPGHGRWLHWFWAPTPCTSKQQIMHSKKYLAVVKSSCNAPFLCLILQRLKLVGNFPSSSVQNRNLLGFFIWVWVSMWCKSSSMYFLRLLQSLLHLPSLTVTWCASCTVRTTSISSTFLRGTSTHLFLCLFPSPTYLAGQPARWVISSTCIACQIKVCQG